MRTLLAAPDKFRSTANAVDVARAISAAGSARGWSVGETPLSDGGEGFLDVYAAVLGASRRVTRVTGPLGGQVDAVWAMAGDTAVIEMARASGLSLVGGAERNDPLKATTRGTGELIVAALRAGARTVVVGCGGSATTDGGEGALDALRPLERLAGVELVVACDVTVPFTGAAARFAAQKGASARQVQFLTRRLEALALQYRSERGVEVEELAGSGAAGGLAGGLAFAGARLVPGFELVADALGLADAVAGADLVVSGEGFLDAESLRGKVVGSVSEMARASGSPMVAVVGECFEEQVPFPVLSLVDMYGRERAMGDTLACIQTAVETYLDGLDF